VAFVLTAPSALAQGLPADSSAPPAVAAPLPDPVAAPTGGLVLPPPGRLSQVTFGQPSPANPFTSVGRDLKRFFSSADTRSIFGVMGSVAGIAYSWDPFGVEESQEHLGKSAFRAGNIGGSFLVQTSAGLATWAAGRATGSRKTVEVGGDLFRAQLVSQLVVLATKLATRRERPDASNRHSFPSGHTASAFATASVLERHFGKKAGVPAYGFAAYVALARMSANKHHMSDVIVGAAVGIAAGRAVTMHVGGAAFDLGVAPTRGGAAVMFTRK
jgi:hypothetical protein